jgi:hypothetical protein
VPILRKLDNSEVERLNRRGNRVDLTPYINDLAGFAVGEWGMIELDADERVPTVKRRYTLAARQLGKALAYRRLRAAGIPFEVRPLDPRPVRAARPAKVAAKGRQPATARPGRRTR